MVQRRCRLYSYCHLFSALYATWSENLTYFTGVPLTDSVAALGVFVADTKVNAASRSITVDILFFLLAAVIWMIAEARRIGMRFVWVYIALAFCIAISVTFPLFLFARELKLAEGLSPEAGSTPGTADYIGFALIATLVLALYGYVAWI